MLTAPAGDICSLKGNQREVPACSLPEVMFCQTCDPDPDPAAPRPCERSDVDVADDRVCLGLSSWHGQGSKPHVSCCIFIRQMGRCSSPPTLSYFSLCFVGQNAASASAAWALFAPDELAAAAEVSVVYKRGCRRQRERTDGVGEF